MPRNYKTVDTASTFIGWGKLDQSVEVEVLTYDPQGATTPNGKKVGRVVGTLVEDCDNYTKLSEDRQHVRLKAGEQVTIDGSVENLNRGLMLASPSRGDFLRLTYTDTYPTDKGNKGKVIKVEHAPAGAAGSVGEDDL
jgi:hypothetical protein